MTWTPGQPVAERQWRADPHFGAVLQRRTGEQARTPIGGSACVFPDFDFLSSLSVTLFCRT
jgi:hypothetical protein